MNSRRHRIFPKYFWPQLESFWGEWIMKWQAKCWVVYIYIKSRRKNKWEGNLGKKRILLKVRGRIGWKCVKSCFDCDCWVRSWSFQRKACKFKELQEFGIFVCLFVCLSLCNMEMFSVQKNSVFGRELRMCFQVLMNRTSVDSYFIGEAVV